MTVLLIIFGIVGGILGGMGMGGGTLLIPLLTIGANMVQQEAQAINLIAFLPMSLIALVIHSRNSLVKYKIGVPIAISGTITSIFSSILASQVKSQNLSIWFGIFLIIIGIFQIYSLWLFKKPSKNMYKSIKNKW